jgi:hypothetical protein
MIRTLANITKYRFGIDYFKIASLSEDYKELHEMIRKFADQ